MYSERCPCMLIRTWLVLTWSNMVKYGSLRVAYIVKPVLSGHSKRPKIVFQDRLSLNAGHKY